MQKGTSVSFTHETYLADSKSGCQTQYLSKKHVSRKYIVFLISSKVYTYLEQRYVLKIRKLPQNEVDSVVEKWYYEHMNRCSYVLR